MYTPDHVAERLRAAGFIDITVRRLKLHVGEWGDDENGRDLGRLGGVVFSGSATPLMEGMSHFMPDDEERAAFSKRVVEELQNPEYHTYSSL